MGLVGLGASVLLDGGSGLVATGAAYATIFAGLGLLSPAASELLNREAEASERATVISLDSLVLQLAGALGSITLMRVAESTGPAPIWYFCGALVAVAAFAYVTIARRSRLLALGWWSFEGRGGARTLETPQLNRAVACCTRVGARPARPPDSARRDHYTCHGHFRADDGRDDAAGPNSRREEPVAEGSRNGWTVRDARVDAGVRRDRDQGLPYTVLGLTGHPARLARLARTACVGRRGERHGVGGHPGTESN